MEKSMLGEINRLRQMTVAELRQEWQRLYGEQTRSRSRDYLWRRLAWRVQEVALGGLSESATSRLDVPYKFQPWSWARPSATMMLL